MSTDSKKPSKVLIYKGPNPKVIVEGVAFVRNTETPVSDDLYKRIQDGEKGLKPGQRHEFVTPGGPEVVSAPAEPVKAADPSETTPKNPKKTG